MQVCSLQVSELTARKCGLTAGMGNGRNCRGSMLEKERWVLLTRLQLGPGGFKGRVPAHAKHRINSKASLRDFCASRQAGPPFLVRAPDPGGAPPNIPNRRVGEPLCPPFPGGRCPKLSARVECPLG